MRKAVRSYNAAVDRMARSGKYDTVPERTTMREEQAFVNDMGRGARGLNQRIAQLRRILTTVRKDAQDVVTMSDGRTAPKWLKREIGYANRARNRDRAQRLSRLYPDFDRLSRPQQAQRLADANLMQVPTDILTDYDALRETWSEVYAGELRYYRNYLAQLDDVTHIVLTESEAAECKSLLEWLINFSPGTLRDVMEEGLDAATIEYLYVSSAYQLEARTRANDIMAYWRGVVEDAKRNA